MLSKKLSEAINAQINAEMWSAYLYLSMSVYFESTGKPGAAKWFKMQFSEEQDHAFRFIKYLHSMDIAPKLMPIAEVPAQWPSLLAAFEDTLKHEKKVTAMIHNLYSIATDEKDYSSESMLRWFIDEQVEEEENAREIIDALKSIENNGLGLYIMDNKLSERK